MKLKSSVSLTQFSLSSLGIQQIDIESFFYFALFTYSIAFVRTCSIALVSPFCCSYVIYFLNTVFILFGESCKEMHLQKY